MYSGSGVVKLERVFASAFRYDLGSSRFRLFEQGSPYRLEWIEWRFPIKLNILKSFYVSTSNFCC